LRTSNAVALESGYVFEGVEVRLPVIVRKARAAAATFVVSSAAARALLPDDGLAIMECAPGRTLFTLGAIDYIDNDLGDYNEVSMAFYVRPHGAPRGIPYLGAWSDFLAGRASTFIHRLPVNQSFTCAAGRGIWGFPKTVERIDFEIDGDRAQCRLEVEGRHVLTLETRRHGSRTLRDSAMTTYSYIDGVLHKTAFRSGADGVGISRRGAALRLGDHPIADELRSLGLPKPALATVWMEHMRGRFEAPQPVA
jgi:hypothetical protein